jgi:hypothetical protein
MIHTGDCLEIMREMADNSVDLVFGSPPYGNQRTYGIGLSFRDDDDWCDWCADRYMECLRISRGLVAWVVEGYTKGGTFHPLPEMLTCEIMRRGGNIRRRMIYHRMGIMGGSPDELAQHHEIVVCASKHNGRLPWVDPTAMGHPPKFSRSGNPTYHSRNGRVTTQKYKPPKKCKASNVINCGAVGGGRMGHPAAHENEAPFPLKLAEHVVRTYCQPGGIVLDPFYGSGTTGHAAVLLDRQFIGIDIRSGHIAITEERIAEVVEGMGLFVKTDAR